MHKIAAVLLLTLATTSFAQKATLETPDVTGLRDKGFITLKKAAGPYGESLSDIGNGYYVCSAEGVAGANSKGVVTLRKGPKSTCNDGPFVLALHQAKDYGSKMKILTSISVDVPKGYRLAIGDCGEKADAALVKFEDKSRFTKISKAWKSDETLSILEVSDTKGISCGNDSYGI